MSKILMFGNQKGGVGKSQCGIMLATALSQPPFSLRVALVDIDDQKSVVACRGIDRRSYPTETVEPYAILDYSIADLQKNIGELDQQYQVVLIDAAGKLDAKADVTQQEISKSLMYVDYLFLPFVSGNHNLDATHKYLKFVQQIQSARTLSQRQLTMTGFVNMFRSRSKKNQYLLEDIESIVSTEGVPFMKNYLNDYALFSDADTYTSLYESSSNESAKQNFAAWVNEICRILGILK